MAEPRRPPYSYVALAEACESLGYQNVYGVVAEFSIPRQSRGTDYVCNLLLVDPSTDGMQRPVEMLVFAPSDVQLPRVRKPGDVIRLHRVKAQLYHDRPQFFGKVGSKQAPFAFCLFDSDPSAGNQPYQLSSGRYYWDEHEAQILAALRQFVAASGAYQLAPRSEYVKPVKDIRPRSFVDVVVKVLGYGNAMPGPPHWPVMFVWDGTDALPFPYRYDTRPYDEEGVPPELQQHIRLLTPLVLPLPGPGDPEQPVLGTALPVVIQGDLGIMGSAAPAVGSWVKLRNIGVRVVGSQMQGFYTRGSKWAPWHEEAGAMQAYQHRLEHSEVAGWAPPTPEGLLARCRHPGRPFTMLRQIVADTPLGVPRKYRALVRVMDYTPQDPAHMCHTAEECGLGWGAGGGDGGAQGGYVYTIKLLLEDSTGQLDAVLFGPDAEVFFGPGLPPRDLSADAQAAEQVLDRLQRLVGKDCESDGGPWMEVCLKAYYIDPSQPWETRQYMIFDTELA